MDYKDQYPTVCVIILTLNRRDELLECLSSLATIDYPKDKIEIVIWDNGSTDRTLKTVKEYFDRIRGDGWLNLKIVTSGQNIGASQGRNRAFGIVSCDSVYILTLDDDAVVLPNTLSVLVEALEVPTAGIVGGQVIYYDKPDQRASGAGFINWWLGKFSEKYVDTSTSCDYVITCCCLIKKEVWNKIGGFDPEYFVYHEDVDFCVRAKRAGFTVLYEPRAVVKHKVRRQTEKKARTIEGLYYLYRNKILLIKKNANPFQKLTSFTLYLLFWLPKILLGSIIANKGVNTREIIVIFKAIYDAIVGKVGKQELF